MPSLYTDLLRRIEALICRSQSFANKNAADGSSLNDFDLALQGLGYMAEMLMSRRPIFGLEPWHPLHFDLPLAAPAEMLLRLKTRAGIPFAPYPFIMAFYNNRFAPEIDEILALCALDQFAQSDLSQISINISAHSLRDRGFISRIVDHLEHINLDRENRVIFEIHESTAHLQMSRPVLKTFRKSGVAFALDDVGLSMNDVMRLAEFEGLADYVKLDRAAVCSSEGDVHSLSNVMSFVSTMLPDALVVAEGVKSANHAYELYERHSDIHFVQGLHLPDEKSFADQFKKCLVCSQNTIKRYRQDSADTEFIM